MNNAPLVFGVSDFVAVVNQTFEYAYHDVAIEGEIANYRISKNKWVYFDLKDAGASVRCFAVLFQLGGVFEDGMMVRVQALPKLHPQYGFSVTVVGMKPIGEGALKRSSDLLRAKLEAEGLFAPERKRSLPYPPRRIALIASHESAAYGDFIKVLNGRWAGMAIDAYDVQVQGDPAIESLLAALQKAAQSSADVVVITRGGGSADDLAAFNDERLVRAIAASRIPTLVAIGHERDESLAELAADKRASTPSNAAELLVPDKKQMLGEMHGMARQLTVLLAQAVTRKRELLATQKKLLDRALQQQLAFLRQTLAAKKQLLAAVDPQALLQRGYALVYDASGAVLRSAAAATANQELRIQLYDGRIDVIAQKMYSNSKDSQSAKRKK